MVLDYVLVRDRLKGPGGTGEWDGLTDSPLTFDIVAGQLVESWEIIDPYTLRYRVRQGIRWQDKAPTYGMEFTAQDIVSTYMRNYKMEGSRYPTSYPFLSNMENPEESVYIDPDDPWVVYIESQAKYMASIFNDQWYNHIYPSALGPPEAEGWVDWKGLVGTGPFLLTDYVKGSSLIYEKNPIYWKTDPMHPGFQLPYVDGVNIKIIPDVSTRLAALRTGKVDILISIPLNDFNPLIKSNPELQWVKGGPMNMTLHLRNDQPPFDDVRVRRAMHMATDRPEILRDYYDGEGFMFFWPLAPIPENRDGFVPLEEMPRSVQELYEYHPDKARELLAEAGYPDGFKTSITASTVEHIDMLSIIKEYWSKVDVDLEIIVKEYGSYVNLRKTFAYEGYIRQWPVTSNSVFWWPERAMSTSNHARINDPLFESTADAASAVVFDWPEVMRIVKEAAPELVDSALLLQLPAVYTVNMWQPWVKSYNGEVSTVRNSGLYRVGEYVWIDQDMKKAMGK